jgi:hypothetical protein
MNDSGSNARRGKWLEVSPAAIRHSERNLRKLLQVSVHSALTGY